MHEAIASRVTLNERASRALMVLCLIAGASLAQSRPAIAQEAPAIALDWVRGEGAESCASSRELSNKLSAALAEVTVTPSAHTIEGSIVRDAARKQYHVRLRLLDANQGTAGIRELTSADEDCARLTPSIVLVLAVLAELGSGATLTFDATTPEGSAQRAQASDSAQSAKSAAQPAAPARPQTKSARPFAVEPWAALALGFGFAPERTLGPVLGLRVRTPWLVAFAWRAAYWPAGRAPIVTPNAVSAGVSFDVIESDLDLCIPLPRDASWWVANCWGAALVMRNARPHGLRPARDSLRVTGTAHAALEVGYAPSSRLLLSLLGSLVAFRRNDAYTFDDVQGTRHVLFRQDHFAGSLAMTIGTRL
jgi:hypothetical protein